MLTGAAASPGIGIGKAVLLRQEEPLIEKYPVSFPKAERQRYLDAVEDFIEEIEDAYDLVLANVSESDAAILGAQIAMIRDPDLTSEVLRAIERQRVNAEYAFSSICNGYIALFSDMKDELMQARAADLRDVKNRMLSILMGVSYNDMSVIPPGSILVAEDIPPSQAARLDPRRVQGIVTQSGTKFSHISIIARALRLPAAVAVDKLLDLVGDGDVLIVDGNAGKAWINPGEAELLDYRERMIAARQKREQLETYKDQPTRTLDGVEIDLAANLAILEELPAILEYNAEGIGLFRTEFMYMERGKPPTNEEQFETYRNMAQAMEGRPVVIRTLDVGGDKDIPYLPMEDEENPSLGHRAIRFCLRHEDLFRAQLSAILRAAAFGKISLMIPMLTSIRELRRVKQLMREVREELRAAGKAYGEDVQLGVMLETPAAVLCADQLARECDFFSLGTNDLTQYVLAVDRSNVHISYMYNDHHPAVLRMVKMAVDAADKAGIPLSVCGEAASDPLLIPVLLGLGVRRFSVAISSLLSVRSQINHLDCECWQRFVPELLEMETPEEVSAFIRSRPCAVEEDRN